MLWRFQDGDWSNITPPGIGPSPAPGYGIAYDTVNDAYGVFGATGMWLVDAGNPTQWIRGATGPRPTAVHGKFKFDSKRNAFIVGYADSSSLTYEVWAYRYKRAEQQVSSPTASAATLLVCEPSGTAGMPHRTTS